MTATIALVVAMALTVASIGAALDISGSLHKSRFHEDWHNAEATVIGFCWLLTVAMWIITALLWWC